MIARHIAPIAQLGVAEAAPGGNTNEEQQATNQSANELLARCMAGQTAWPSCSVARDHPAADNVGILAIKVYFPANYVSQAELEAFDGVSAGKYTIGLGQESMAFCGDREDVVSMSLTVLQSLFETYGVSPAHIGRLEVGTESALDRSKSVKSSLMTLFEECGNSDVEGVDCTNACYGGTSALLNAVNWVESRAWDGRYAAVVMADVATYAAGPARPSGGCGAVALLIGPDAPLALERGLNAAHMEHAYDFYKPAGLYPLVAGRTSTVGYLRSLDRCYAAIVRKSRTIAARSGVNSRCQPACQLQQGTPEAGLQQPPAASVHSQARQSAAANGPCTDQEGSARHHAAVTNGESNSSLGGSHAQLRERQAAHGAASHSNQEEAAGDACRHRAAHGGAVRLRDFDFCVLHAPFNKMVRKGFARLVYHDHLRSPSEDAAGLASAFADFPADADKFAASSYTDAALSTAAVAASAGAYDTMVAPSTLLPTHTGNSYTASLYMGLASLVESQGAALEGRRLLIYSYGSGIAAGMFVLRGRAAQEGRISLADIAAKGRLRERLQDRTKKTPQEFVAALELAESRYGAADYEPTDPLEDVWPRSYYLVRCDKQYRRQYARK